MANNIITNHTLEQYNKKYRNLRHRLLKITKKEVEDFDKKNPTNTKGYLLKDRKWCLIGDTYYEIPKAPRYTWFRNLNAGVQTAVCLLGAGVVATAITVPLVLLNQNKGDNIPDIEISESTKSDIEIKDKKYIGDKLEMKLTIKDEKKEFTGNIKVTIGNTVLKEKEEFNFIKDTGKLSIKKSVIETNKGVSIIIEPELKDKQPGPTPEEKYAISLTANPTEGGSVSGAGEYVKGASVTVTATPTTGYSFDGWYEGSSKVSSDASYTFNVTSARSLVAKFTPNISGTITITGDPIVGQTLTATYTGTETITYQWYRGNAEISGATSSTYTLVDNDIDNTIKVKAIGTGTYSGSVESKPTNTVIIIYRIDWNTTEHKFDGTNERTLYSQAKYAKTIKFIKDDSAEGICVGEDNESLNPIYASWDSSNSELKIWSKGKIAFENDDIPSSGSQKGIFDNCVNTEIIDFSNIYTKFLTSMDYMFFNCEKLKEVDFSNFDTSNTANMNFMFEGCDLIETLDLYSFDTSNVTSMNHMFANCGMLKDINVTSFNTAKVTTMISMFEASSRINSLNLSSFSTESLEFCGSMFKSYLNVGSKLETIIVSDKFDLTKVSNSSNMFTNCSNLIGGCGTKCDGKNNIDKTFAKIDKQGQYGYLTSLSKTSKEDFINKYENLKQTYSESSKKYITTQITISEFNNQLYLNIMNPTAVTYSSSGDRTTTFTFQGKQIEFGTNKFSTQQLEELLLPESDPSTTYSISDEYIIYSRIATKKEKNQLYYLKVNKYGYIVGLDYPITAKEGFNLFITNSPS